MITTVEDIMTKKVVSVNPDTPVFKAASLMDSHNFDGLPVEDNGKLVGILTQYDLLKNAAHVHLPTLQKILQNLNIKDGKELQAEKEKIASLKVADVMNSEPLTTGPHVSLEEIISLFKDHHRVNPIPVVDAEDRVIGVVSRYDIVKILSSVGM